MDTQKYQKWIALFAVAMLLWLCMASVFHHVDDHHEPHQHHCQLFSVCKTGVSLQLPQPVPPILLFIGVVLVSLHYFTRAVPHSVARSPPVSYMPSHSTPL